METDICPLKDKHGLSGGQEGGRIPLNTDYSKHFREFYTLNSVFQSPGVTSHSSVSGTSVWGVQLPEFSLQLSHPHSKHAFPGQPQDPSESTLCTARQRRSRLPLPADIHCASRDLLDLQNLAKGLT